MFIIYEILLLPPFIGCCLFCDNGMFLLKRSFSNSCIVDSVVLDEQRCFLESFYREDATRSVLDLRDPGRTTLLFLITPTSSKTHLSLIFCRWFYGEIDCICRCSVFHSDFKPPFRKKLCLQKKRRSLEWLTGTCQ